jgi:hypothetical protein
MPSSRHPSQTLIMVNVTFNLGQPQYTYLFFGDGQNADLALLAPGDQVGWLVRVQSGSGWIQPPYTLIFSDPSILGIASISVHQGGSSGFITVQSVIGKSKYSVAVAGISPIGDPQIQVDPNGTFVIALATHYQVRWTASTNRVEYSHHGQWVPFPDPLTISIGDSIEFTAVVTPPAIFEINFPANLNPTVVWQSPFGIQTSAFYAIAPGANETTGSLIAKDKSDSGNTFHFVAQLTDGSITSAVCNLQLV